MKRIILTISFVVITSLGVFAQNTYYVAKNGSDSNPGTKEEPWLTINQAFSTGKVDSPGDTLFIRSGVYNEFIKVDKSGDSLAPIVFSAYPGEYPVIDGTGVVDRNDKLIFVRGNYVVIRGLEVQNSKGYGIFGKSVEHVTIENMHIHNTHLSGIGFNESKYCVYRNNVIHDVFDYANDDPGNDGDGLYIAAEVAPPDSYSTDYGHFIVEGNIIFNCTDEGIDTWTSRYNVIKNNFIYHIGYSNYSDGGYTGSVDQDNTQGDKNGMKLGRGGMNMVHNNIVFDIISTGFDSNPRENSGVMDDTLYNNTAYNCGGYGYQLYGGPRIVAINNLEKDTQGYYKKVLPDDIVFVTNSWDLEITNPQFISTNPWSVNFLRLSSGSPAIDVGTDVGLPYNGTKPDIGAFETE